MPAPWLNVDVHHGRGVTPDVVASMAALPFADGSAERVYCGHVLEHIRPEMLPQALGEVRRVLAPGGQICVVGPDFARAADNPEWHPLLSGIVCGGNRWPGDEHHWTASGPSTLGFVRPVFPEAVEVDISALAAEGWPLVDDVGWQFAILAQ